MITYPDSYASSTPPGQWVTDVLGSDFFARTLPLARDEEGEVVATLVKHAPEDKTLTKIPVLFVHGWSDYFFNRGFAEFWTDRGHPFYALDLRKYGRSLRSWQSPGLVNDLVQYDEEIWQAYRLIRSEHGSHQVPFQLILSGHSTGGLTLALWAHRNPRRVRAMVLNSPWLEFQGSALMRQFTAAMIDPWSVLTPRRELHLPKPEHYYRSMADTDSGEWSLHPTWRPRGGFPVYPAWVKAILSGHATVAQGLQIPAPIWVSLAAKSQFWSAWRSRMQQVDIVLDVEQVAARVFRLGPEVSLYRQRAAMHDVFASRAEVRAEAYAALERWRVGYLAEPT
ncbi:alpha/beta hydrolase [Micrococcoides hystricis]|uniref:Alpha/beta hydrolase n=1 Tax=Micrococcoides hystricis TaxID=1572761 RepID=A0ABV6P7C9_9MICC